jgi:pimeloyl-ACP methyl ester carboxylesterase
MANRKHTDYNQTASMNPHLATADQAKSPSWWLLMLEWRAPWELGASLAASPLLQMAPRGDGHPVLVFPGLAASDLSTVPLRNFLQSRHYVPYGWDLGMNFGPRPGVLAASLNRIRELVERHEAKVSLVGWSLGGVYARELAKIAPDLVRGVITLGTPFNGNPKATNAWRLYEFASGSKVGDPTLHAGLAQTPPVPTTSVFSRSDGIVAWKCSLEKAEHRCAESVEVRASHVGLGMNPAAWYVLADRLAQVQDAWQPFHREGWRALVYPDPSRPE